jgi:hypothetical protein
MTCADDLNVEAAGSCPRDRGGDQAGRVRHHGLTGLYRRENVEDLGCVAVTAGTGHLHGQSRCGFDGNGRPPDQFRDGAFTTQAVANTM